jgi:uncharacterized membrane protein YbjE (DUF340 family)
MVLVLSFLGLGMAFGFLLRRRAGLIRLADRLMAWMLYGLLFFLGVWVSVEQTVVGQLGSLSLQGLALAVTGIAGSILFVRLLAGPSFREAPREE